MNEELRERLVQFLRTLIVGPDEYTAPCCAVCGSTFVGESCDDDCERVALLALLSEPL